MILMEMMRAAHIVFGIMVGLVFTMFFNSGNKYIFLFIVAASSLVPDIDEPNSTIGRKFKLVSKTAKFAFGHRGFFHSVYVPLMIFVLLYYGFGVKFYYSAGFFVGYFSHLILDGFTKKGVNLLHPVSTLRLQGFVNSGSSAEKVFTVGFVVLIVMLIL